MPLHKSAPGRHPARSRDSHIKVCTCGGSFGTLYIQPSGLMQAYSLSSPGAATPYTSLDAVSFPLGF